MSKLRRTLGFWFTFTLTLGGGLLLGTPVVSAAPVSTVQLTHALQWRSVGPYYGGRVTSVAGVANEPYHFYAAYAGAGVWETTDYGVHWKPISDKHFTNNNVGAIAIAPSNSKIIYAGTGDPAIRNTFLTGDGMYKSTDGGRTWSHIGLKDTRIISWIVVDPHNPDVVYAAAMGHVWAPNPERGVYKSTDGGQTWNKILFVNNDTGAIMLAMDASNPQVLYASMWETYRRPWDFSSGGKGSGIYKTTDGGAHWTNLTKNPGLPTGIWGKAGIAVSPADSNVVYTLVQADYKGKPGGLFRSNDAGKTWNFVNDDEEITQRAFYYMRVFPDPKDPNTIYMPNVNMFVSHDGGKTLKELNPPHGDNHALWINPTNTQTLVQGNDGGATVSFNGGESWSPETNQPTGQFYHVNLDDQFPFHIYGAQQDRGSVESASAVDAGGIPGDWDKVVGGEESWVVPTPKQPWVSYGASYYGKIWRENRRQGNTVNVDPWPEWKFGLAGTEVRYRYGWIHYAMGFFSKQDPQQYLLGSNVLLETRDQGLNWKELSPDLTRNDKTKQQRPGGPISADVTSEEMFDTISAIAVSPLDKDVIWVGTDDGLVQLTTNGGAKWTQVRPPKLPEWSTLTSVEASHTDKGTAYVSASRYMWDDHHPYLYKTTDYGKTWTDISNGLPSDQYTLSVRQDPDQPNLLLAATRATVYMSLDDGGHWQPLTLNLPTVEVTDIQFQPEQHAIVISTFGRAYWVLDDAQFLEQLAAAKVDDASPYLFKPQQAWLLKRRVGGYGSSTRTGNSGENLAPGTKVFFNLPADYNGQPVKLSFTDQGGKLVNSYTLPLKPKTTPGSKKPAKVESLHAGMNQFLWNMRYPDAVDVKGIKNTGFSASEPVGPEVLPGTYTVALEYAGKTEQQTVEVKLDPRLDTTPAGLQQRFDALMQVHDAMNRLNTSLNAALDARTALEKASGGKAKKASEALDRDINKFVDLKIQSGEGGLVYPPRLRAWLSYISNALGEQFVQPTPAMIKVKDEFVGEANAAVKTLDADVASAKAATGA
jgi:photosystem II stability/assembly factor-like uncharacterized protein